MKVTHSVWLWAVGIEPEWWENGDKTIPVKVEVLFRARLTLTVENKLVPRVLKTNRKKN